MKRRPLLAVLGGVAAAGCGVVLLGQSPPDAIYLTAAVEHGDLSTTVTAIGTLDAVATVEVGSQLSGQVGELLVDFNDMVSEGQPLARLDPRTFHSAVREAQAGLQVAQAQVLRERAMQRNAAAEVAGARAGLKVAKAGVERARARLLEAERDLNRKRALAGTETLAAAHVDQAAAAYDAAVAELHAAEAEVEAAGERVVGAEARQLIADANLLHAEAAERQQAAQLDGAWIDLARTVITAPSDGVVIDRNVNQGQTVAASLEAPTLFTIAQDLRRMEVHAKIDEADIGQIRPRQPATFTVDAYPDRAFRGTVEQIRKAPELVENVVTYTVVLSTENRDLDLLPGMTAIVRIVVDEARDVLKVPNAALRFHPTPDAGAPFPDAAAAGRPASDSTAVLWVPNEDGRPAPVRVGLGRSQESATELVTGPLRAGQPVIVGTAAPAPDRSWLGFSWSR